MHTEAMWPIHGKYVCKKCFREYPVEWAEHFVSAEGSSVQPESPVWLAEHR
jgi:hypothetical protein